MGYDNAHAVGRKGQGKKFIGHKHPYDHSHLHDREGLVPYEFSSAEQLLVDFFAEVDQVLREMGKR